MDYTAGEKLEIMMKRKGVTMTELAERMNQTRQNVSYKFNRDNFSEEDLKAICDALEIEYTIEFKERP